MKINVHMPLYTVSWEKLLLLIFCGYYNLWADIIREK